MSSYAYIQNLRLPHEMAHSVAVVKSAEAAAQLIDPAYLVFPKRSQPTALTNTSIDKYYSVAPNTVVLVPLRVPELLNLPNGIERVYLHFRHLVIAWWFAIKAWWFGYQKQIDIIQTGDREILVLLALMRWLYSPQVIYDLHNDFSDRYNRGLLRLGQRVISLAVVNCQYLKAYLHSINPYVQIMIEPNGYDPIQFRKTAIARKRLGISDDDFVIGYVGRLETMGMEKGVGLLLTSVATLINKRGMQIKILLVGGPDQMLEKYRQVAKKLKIDTFVICVSQVPQSQVARYMKVLDLGTLLYPDTFHYRHKMSPMKAIEYVAAGVPVVASKLPTLTELLGDLAWYVPPGNIKALRKVLNYAYHQDKDLQSQARRHFAKEHTWEKRQQRIFATLPTSKD